MAAAARARSASVRKGRSAPDGGSSRMPASMGRCRSTASRTSASSGSTRATPGARSTANGPFRLSVSASRFTLSDEVSRPGGTGASAATVRTASVSRAASPRASSSTPRSSVASSRSSVAATVASSPGVTRSAASTRFVSATSAKCSSATSSAFETAWTLRANGEAPLAKRSTRAEGARDGAPSLSRESVGRERSEPGVDSPRRTVAGSSSR